MKKIEKILILLGMLKTDIAIDIGTIQRKLEITERTAYRYINTLIDAGIPVHYEPELRGYRVLTPIKMNIDSFNIGELFLIIIGLELLSKRVKEHYQTQIGQLKEKISARRIHLIDELLESLSTTEILETGDQDLSQFVIDRFIHYANQNKETLQLIYQDNGSGLKKTTIKKPGLRFRNGWEVCENPSRTDSEISIPLTKILLAKIK